MDNQVSVKYVGYRLNYTSGRLSLGPPERGAAEKIVFNKERTKGWGWGWAIASVEEGRVGWWEVHGGRIRAEMVG